MSVEAAIETEYGERLLIWRKGGIPGGRAVFSFLSTYDMFCLSDENNSEIKEWFADLGSKLGQSICEFIEPLILANYYGDWDYKINEYARYLSKSLIKLSEEEFKQTISQLEKKWVPASEILEIINVLLTIFTSANLKTTWWFSRDETVDDFVALKETIEIAKRAVNCKIRIQFS